jgi:2-aminobenzoate-CoA ligase
MPADRWHGLLPPRELWPERIYTLPEVRYPDVLNVSVELVDAHVAARRGDTMALVGAGQRLTYAALQARVNQAGNALVSLGVGPGDRVLLRFPNRPEMVAIWLAIQRIGAVGVSTMPMLRARELAGIIDDAEPVACVVAADLLDEIVRAWPQLACRPRLLVWGDLTTDPGLAWQPFHDLAAQASPVLEAHATPRDEPAIIAYTSGSTGVPKGACHSASDMLASADTYARHVIRPTSADVFGGHPTLAFTYGLGGLLVFPLRFGASTVLLEAFTPEALLDLVARERITVLFCAATTYRMLMQVDGFESRFDLSSLRLAVSAGEPLPRPVADEWMRRTDIDVIDSLGSTEMFQVFVCQRPGAIKPGATGLAVPGYEVRVVDERLADVPRGTPGLLAVRGPTGCRYWRKPERQAEYVRDGWNIPNDICVQDADGYIWYQCRNDDLIICAGHNIAGPEIEAVLLEHPAVLEVAVVASPDPVKGQVPKAYVVLKPGVEGDETLAAAMQEHVRRELAAFKYPRRLEFVSSLPRTETGKIRRGELRTRELAHAAGADHGT